MRGLIVAAVLASTGPAVAHSGGTDSNGCHNSSGGHHCHGGGGDEDVDGDTLTVLFVLGAIGGLALIGYALASSQHANYAPRNYDELAQDGGGLQLAPSANATGGGVSVFGRG